MSSGSISDRVRLWTGQIRTQGFDALWSRLVDAERDEFVLFARDFEAGFEEEIEQRWQSAVDRYRRLAERFPAWSDIAMGRANQVIADKINRAIRYYNQGVQAVEAKAYLKALQYFDLALSVDQHMERALYNLGMTHKYLYVSDPVANKLHRLTAIETFKRLLKQHPHNLKAAAQIEQLERL